MTGAALSATASGVIALVIGLLLAWKEDAPRTRLILLVGGSTSVTAGIFGKVTGQISHTLTSVSTAATTTIFGSAVGIIGLLILAWIIGRDFMQKEMSRVTDAAAIVMPPLASSFGGLVWALCLLVAGVVAWVISQGWLLGVAAATMIHSQVG